MCPHNVGFFMAKKKFSGEACTRTPQYATFSYWLAAAPYISLYKPLLAAVNSGAVVGNCCLATVFLCVRLQNSHITTLITAGQQQTCEGWIYPLWVYYLNQFMRFVSVQSTLLSMFSLCWSVQVCVSVRKCTAPCDVSQALSQGAQHRVSCDCHLCARANKATITKCATRNTPIILPVEQAE